MVILLCRKVLAPSQFPLPVQGTQPQDNAYQYNTATNSPHSQIAGFQTSRNTSPPPYSAAATPSAKASHPVRLSKLQKQSVQPQAPQKKVRNTTSGQIIDSQYQATQKQVAREVGEFTLQLGDNMQRQPSDHSALQWAKCLADLTAVVVQANTTDTQKYKSDFILIALKIIQNQCSTKQSYGTAFNAVAEELAHYTDLEITDAQLLVMLSIQRILHATSPENVTAEDKKILSQVGISLSSCQSKIQRLPSLPQATEDKNLLMVKLSGVSNSMDPSLQIIRCGTTTISDVCEALVIQLEDLFPEASEEQVETFLEEYPHLRSKVEEDTRLYSCTIIAYHILQEYDRESLFDSAMPNKSSSAEIAPLVKVLHKHIANDRHIMTILTFPKTAEMIKGRVYLGLLKVEVLDDEDSLDQTFTSTLNLAVERMLNCSEVYTDPEFTALLMATRNRDLELPCYIQQVQPQIVRPTTNPAAVSHHHAQQPRLLVTHNQFQQPVAKWHPGSNGFCLWSKRNHYVACTRGPKKKHDICTVNIC